MARSRVTVVVATHDRRPQLQDSVPRHLALPERPAVIVVDNASTDGGPRGLPVEVIRLDRNLGAAGRNVGAEAARTPYVALTDDDAWWSPGALARAADLLDEHPRLAVVQAKVLVGPGERLDPTCAAMARSPLPAHDGQPGHPLLSFVACAAVVRRSAFLEAGGFSERFAVGGEEELLGWDLVAAGHWLSYVPEIVAHHHPPAVPGGRPERRAVTVRNTLWTSWLRRPVAVAARHSVGALAKAVRDPATARGVGRALAGLPWVLRDRRVSPPRVEAMLRALERG